MNITIWLYCLGHGGAERVVTQLASSFASSGHNVTILTHTSDNPYATELHSNVHLTSLENWFSKRLKPKTLFCLWSLIHFLKANKQDVIFTTSLNHNVLLLLISRLFKLNSKIVIRETNTLGAQNKNMMSKIFAWMAQFLYPKADCIVCPSIGVADDLKTQTKRTNENTTVIYNPIDTNTLHEQAQQALNDEWLKERLFILSAGRLVPQKGYDILIKAWAPIYKTKQTALVILGDGPERDNLSNIAKKLGVEDGLHMPGFDSNPFRYMSRAEIYILSSYYEGLPNTLLQAIACDCPVIATDCPSGPAEILENGKLGKLVKVGDVKSLENAIAQQLENSSQDQNIWQQIKEKYDSEKIAEQYIHAFLDSPSTSQDNKE